MPNRHTPGCHCCSPNCTIFSDDFNRADDTDIGPKWTETAGDWEIVSNELTTSDANAELTTAAAVPVTADTYGKITMRIKATASGDIICIGDKSGSSVFLYAFKFGTGSYVGTSYLGGDESRDSCTLNTNTWYSIEIGDFLKVDGNIIRVDYNQKGLIGTAKFNNFSIGTTTLSGSAYFDDIEIFDFLGAADECPHFVGSCGWFNVDPIPASITLVIAGAAAAGLYDYTNLNGTYSLTSLGNCSYEITGLSIGIIDSSGGSQTITRITFANFNASSNTAEITTDVTTYYRTDAWSTAGDPLLGDANTITLNALTTGVGTATLSY